MAVPAEGRLLGLDLGSARIGVAVTDAAQTIATGVTFVTRSGELAKDHGAVAGLVAEHSAVAVVVGLPLLLSGRLGPAARHVLDEVNEMRAVLDVPVDTVDERLTTVAAASALRRAGRPARRQRPVIDQTAAAMLLQTWIDRRRGAGGRTDG